MLTSKPNYRTPQKALEYVLYQTISSHFKNSITRVGNELSRVNRKIAYGEESKKNQAWLQSSCEKYFKRKVAGRVPAGFWNEKVEVTFHKRKNGNTAEIIFHGENTVLCVAGIWGRNEHHFIDPMVFKRAA